MEREIIILMASTKGKWFQIAGIDRQSNRWIRLCSRYSRARGALPFEQLMYDDLTPVRLFDVVGVRLKRADNVFEQPERFFYDASYHWQRIEHVSLTDVIALHGFDDREFVFCNQNRFVSNDELRASARRESLLLMYVNNLDVKVTEVDWQKKISLQFEHAGKFYSDFAIGDLRLRNYYLARPNGLHHFADAAAVVFSLSEKYLGEKYYKTAAQILRWQ